MSREIKFRAWDKKNKKMRTVIFIEFIDESEQRPGVSMIGEKNYPYWLDMMDVELMQYTGLKDKNGKEIYEGDIAKLKYCTALYTCTWSSEAACFYWQCNVSNDHSNMHYESEVIGNIYQNPELLNA